MIYFCGWISVYVALVLGRVNKDVGKFFSYVSIGFLTLIAFSRGPVGTDTANYEALVSDARVVDFLFGGVEPGFLGLVHFLGYFFDSDVFVVRLLALIYGFGMLVFFSLSKRSVRFVFLAFIVPTFFFSYSMNALRIGLASIFLIFSARSVLRENYLSFAFFSISAVFFHYSTVFSVLFLMVLGVELRGWKGYLTYFSVFILLALFLYAGASVLDDKSATYADYQAPDALSGLSQVLMLSVLFVGVLFSGLNFRDKGSLLFTGLLFTVIFWMLARETYAGLRLLDLLVFVFPLSFMVKVDKRGLILSPFCKACFVIAGMLSIGAQYRGFLVFEGGGATPFLPYSTFWG